MFALLLALMSCIALDPDIDQDRKKLIESLDEEYALLLEKDPRRNEVECAAKLLEQTNRSDHWTDYMQACRILNDTRSKAAIPLLLKYMVVHGVGEGGGDAKTYATTIATLSGYRIEWTLNQPIADRANALVPAVQKAYTEWWLQNRDKISLDFVLLPESVLRSYVKDLKTRLRDLVDAFRYIESDNNGQLMQFLTMSLLQIRDSDRTPNIDNQIHPVMLPIILEEAGYKRATSSEASWANSKVPLEYLVPLVRFRRNGVAFELDAIARDSEQPASVRLLCVLAIYIAGEDLMDDVLLSIAETEKSVRLRSMAILSLSHSQNVNLIGPALTRFLDDPNVDIKLAAVHGMMGCKPARAIPKLQELLTSDRMGRESSAILRVLSGMKTPESERVLFDFLERTQSDLRFRESTYDALSAVSSVTGRSWTEAGAHNPEYYEQVARKALSWRRSLEKARIARERLEDRQFLTGDDSMASARELHKLYQNLVDAIFSEDQNNSGTLFLPVGATDAPKFWKMRQELRERFEVAPVRVRPLSVDVCVIDTPTHAIAVVKTATTGYRILSINPLSEN